MKGHGDWERLLRTRRKQMLSLPSGRQRRRIQGTTGLSTSVPWNAMHQILLEIISRYMKDKKVVGSYQYRFMKGKYGLISLIAFCHEMDGLVNERRAVDIAHPYFSKVFDTISSNIVIAKQIKYRLDKNIVRWIKNCLN